jgi:hypothetical protein
MFLLIGVHRRSSAANISLLLSGAGRPKPAPAREENFAGRKCFAPHFRVC